MPFVRPNKTERKASVQPNRTKGSTERGSVSRSGRVLEKREETKRGGDRRRGTPRRGNGAVPKRKRKKCWWVLADGGYLMNQTEARVSLYVLKTISSRNGAYGQYDDCLPGYNSLLLMKAALQFTKTFEPRMLLSFLCTIAILPLGKYANA